MAIRKESYWSLEDGDRPFLDEFNPRSREVVLFRLDLPLTDMAHLNSQEVIDFSTPEYPIQRTHIIDPLAENAVYEEDKERIEAVLLELARIKRHQTVRL